ncbi:MAG: hypothetical protein ACXAC7_20895, partial [Candidatus Hodarchaeales archaeon]
ILPFDNYFINNIRKKVEFSVLHLHGDDIFFDTIAKELSVTAINWHATETDPTIAECNFEGGLLGGLNELKLLELIGREKVRDHLQAILKNAGENVNRLIIAPGCVLPLSMENSLIEIISSEIQSLSYT